MIAGRDLLAVRQRNGGLIVPTSVAATNHREAIFKAVDKHRLPTIYGSTYFADEGGMIAYGVNYINQYRQAASYVDRILRGAKPAELPVQAPTTFELVVNLKTARSLGLKVPDIVLLRADRVIQ